MRTFQILARWVASLLLLMLGAQVLRAQPRLFSATAAGGGDAISYFAEDAIEGQIILDANNGFFDKGMFRGAGQYAVPDADQEYISAHFDHLRSVSSQAGGSARWYVWIPAAGQVVLRVHLQVPASEAGVRWRVGFGEQSRVVTTQESDSKEAQDWSLSFQVKSTGKQTVSMTKLDSRSTPASEIHRIKVSGSSIKGAKLIRARWRPSAVHTRFTSSSCPDPVMWVFESQNVSEFSSYSPITTPFGYFGASFDADGKAAGGVNFSMWAASKSASKAPPLVEMPRLIATGNPNAEFSGFGHEGSGVKIRNWEPYSHHPKSVIQALRLETQGGIDTYYGYLFDERIDRWVLYAAARRPSGRSSQRGGLRVGAFCEIPGPPRNQRTGDQVRTIRRRGWFYDKDGVWHVVDTQTLGDKPEHTNKFIGQSKQGWLTSGTGGVEMVTAKTTVVIDAAKVKLPGYLQPAKADQLFGLPVIFGSTQATDVAATSATVQYDMIDAGANAKGTVYYGPTDCLTFIKRKLHGTERKGVSGLMLSDERTWAHQTEEQGVTDGVNRFSVTDLKPGSEYFYRILITSESGKSWDFRSGSFRTRL
jgi:hypothetical protein